MTVRRNRKCLRNKLLELVYLNNRGRSEVFPDYSCNLWVAAIVRVVLGQSVGEIVEARKTARVGERGEIQGKGIRGGGRKGIDRGGVVLE